tara:strand:+ start:657 stop:1424 length:768 start_codon:yes stop_codon:yes gene_type:complete
MIKKILFIASLFCAGFVSAQSFQLLDYNGDDISGTTHYEYGDAPALDSTKFHIKNLTGTAKNFAVKVEKVYNNYTLCGNLAVCFGVDCYSGGGGVSGVQIINNSSGDAVAANSIYTKLKVSPQTWCWNNCAADSAEWIVTIYDETNPSDDVTATIIWRCGVAPVSVNEISNDVVKLNAFPNPAISSLTISYLIETNFDDAVIDVYDVLGQKMISKGLNSSKGQVDLNVETLNSGVYFYSIKVDGQIFKTERVIVK